MTINKSGLENETKGKMIRCPSIVKVVVTGMFMLVLLSFVQLPVLAT